MRKMSVYRDTVKKVGRGVFVTALAFVALSCATRSDSYKDIDSAVDNNSYNAAVVFIEKGQEQKKPIYPEKNSVMLFLDKGILEYYAGNYQQSNNDLQEAERLIEEAFTKSVSADLMSYIANDNTKEYPGEDFEDIYINVFNALNYYKQDNLEAALVEIRKLSLQNGKLDMLARKYENAGRSFSDKAMEQFGKLGFRLTDSLPKPGSLTFTNSALARYLAALFFLGDGNRDGARIEFDQIASAFAASPKVYTNPVPKTVAEDRAVPAGQARLNVIAFSGLSPVKEEGKFTQHWAFMNNSTQRNPVFKLPIIVDRPSKIDRIEVVVGENKFDLELLEDMGSVIKETYSARFAELFFKTYLRVLFKYIASDTAAEVSKRVGGTAGAIGNLVAGVGGKIASDVSEAADIRMSRYLPSKAYIGGINIAPGTYNVTINFYSGSSVIAKVEHTDVSVKAGALNLVDGVSLK